MKLFSASLLVSVVASGMAPVCFAQTTPTFSDVPLSHQAFSAVEYLKEQGILQGYADGTFKPNQKVNRAEAIKILVAPLVSETELKGFTSSAYSDVAAGAWYLPYVESARQTLQIIDGPPKTSTFRPSAPVKHAELLKMLELSQGENPAASYSEIRLPLAMDVVNADDWYYPYMRYAIASSMVTINSDGTLEPAKELTRADVSMLMYRYFMFKQNRRTQALLSETENEIVNVLQQLDAKDINQAAFASARALIAARGALTSKPDEPLVKGAIKTAEGFQLLVQAYVAGVEGRLDDVLKLTGEAWKTADKARAFSLSLDTLASQMQAIAKNMADNARSLQAQP
jgi:hypothetical protein